MFIDVKYFPFLSLVKGSMELLCAHFKKHTMHLTSKSDERFVLFLILGVFA